MNFLAKIDHSIREELIPKKFGEILKDFHSCFATALEKDGLDPKAYDPLFCTYLDKVIENAKTPYPFPPYHQALRAPFDYTQLSLDIIRPLIDLTASHVLGQENLATLQAQLAAGENAILLANHQTEPDPQALHLLLEPLAKGLPEKMVIVAGSRVTTDPLAIPFSLGLNLLCIHSKKHTAETAQEQQKNILHNQVTMRKMEQLLIKGGACIYVAPSGGRDRKDADGEVNPAPFDPQSIEMLRLVAAHSDSTTHFYPLALATYPLLPPPQSVESDIGEVRHTRRTPVHLFLGPELDFTAIQTENEKQARLSRAQYAWEQVNTCYQKLKELL